MHENLDLTVIVGPRDRYSGVVECIEEIYRHTSEPFELLVLDLGYPKRLRQQIDESIATKKLARVVEYGLITPMAALQRILPKVKGKKTAWIDNDSRVTAEWYEPLKRAVDEGAAIASPLILEKDGVDIGAKIRNHLHQSEIRVVEYQGRELLIEHKLFRRELPENLPESVSRSETFELHGVVFDTDKLRALDIPQMVVREHIDICMQLEHKGEAVVIVPQSVVLFDNLGTRMELADMRYFFFRWSERLSRESHREFERRWGYGFYSEQGMYNWAFRRKAFLICRFFFLPVNLSNRIGGVAKKIFRRDWDPLPDPIGKSHHLYSHLIESDAVLAFSSGGADQDPGMSSKSDTAPNLG
ncbi:MAG: glycosyltransferase [Pseudomonadota bacterium]